MSIFVSGGASGADLEWMKACQQFGYSLDVFSFKGHNVTVDRTKRSKVNVIEGERLDRYHDVVRACSRVLERNPPKDEYKKNLLYRNMWIADECDFIIAVGWLDAEGKVQGGTAWACCFALMQDKMVYFIDQRSDKVYAISSNGRVEFSISQIPFPSSNQRVGLIGSRDLQGDSRLWPGAYFHCNLEVF